MPPSTELLEERLKSRRIKLMCETLRIPLVGARVAEEKHRQGAWRFRDLARNKLISRQMRGVSPQVKLISGDASLFWEKRSVVSRSSIVTRAKHGEHVENQVRFSAMPAYLGKVDVACLKTSLSYDRLRWARCKSSLFPAMWAYFGRN